MARIKTRPDELRDQLNQASAAATAAGPAWPASAPTPAALTAAATAINTDLTNVNTTEGTLATQRQTRDTDVGTGRLDAERVHGHRADVGDAVLDARAPRARRTERALVRPRDAGCSGVGLWECGDSSPLCGRAGRSAPRPFRVPKWPGSCAAPDPQ